GPGTGRRGTGQPARPGSRPARSVTPGLFDEFDEPPQLPSVTPAPPLAPSPPPTAAAPPTLAVGGKARARDILAAIRTLHQVEREKRPATPGERDVLARFPGFGAVALSVFPDPVSGTYKDESWRAIGEELESLLTPDEYASAKRTTFNAFY